jgi:hypothetical protein
MDYMSDLPSTKHGNDCVFVFVDRFSKMAILTACKKNMMAKATTKLFFECMGSFQAIKDNHFLSG